jgi:addiction module RelE/StbE family toxin
MKKKVRILRRAQTDLIEIRNYIERESPRTAERFVDNLITKIEGLEDSPRMGVVPRDPHLQARGYRVLIEGEYLIFYKVLSRQVRIYRVLHGRRKYRHLLR